MYNLLIKYKMSSDICYTWHCAITIWCGKYVCSSDEELYVKSHHCVLTLPPPRKYMYPAIYSKAKIRRRKMEWFFFLISFPWTPTLKCTKCISEQTLYWLSYISKVIQIEKFSFQFSIYVNLINFCFLAGYEPYFV